MIFWVIFLIPLATSAKKTSRKIKKKPTINDNILYVTEQNMSFAFEDLPAVFLLVQLGSDKDGRFRTRADFLAAASNLGSRCYFALMDGDRNQKFVKSTNQKDSKGYFFYRYGRLVGRYSGESSTDEITKFAMSRTGIAFTTFDEYTIAQDFIESNDGCIVLYLEKTGGPLFEKYGKWAETLRDNHTFGLCPDVGIADELDVETFPSLILYRQTDHTKAVYPDDLNEATLNDIIQWIDYHKKPSFEPFQIDKQYEYYNGKPILLFFTPVEETESRKAISVISNIASTYGNEFKVLSINAVTGNRFMTGLGFGRYADPAVCILIYNHNGKLTKYLHGEEDPFTEDDISHFIDDYKSKKIKPHIRSSILPEENNGSVVEINALTFNDTIMNTDKNALILYFEDWDRIYQDFLPEFTALADKFIKGGINNLEFFKFNVASNDLIFGPDPQKTPAIYLFKNGDKRRPILFSKKLNKKEIEEFINEKLSIKVDDL